MHGSIQVVDQLKSGGQLRQFLTTAAETMGGLADGCRTAMREEDFERKDRLEAFLVVLDRDAQASVAAMALVLAQHSSMASNRSKISASMCYFPASVRPDPAECVPTFHRCGS
jgi:hypothetical protein